ncbi:MAG: sigma-E factor negative regulatory protein [Methylotenera sp.]|jgi:sigma-E factor negative regulatory protein RseA
MKNQLSALIDGEFEIEESEHLMTALKANGELKDVWKTYHLIGDVMRDGADMPYDFSDRVMRVLDSEPTILAVNKQMIRPIEAKKKKATPVLWSVAASVAAVMFVGLMVFKLQLSDSEDLTPVEIAQSMPLEYLQAHQSLAPSGSAYYIQSASFKDPN